MTKDALPAFEWTPQLWLPLAPGMVCLRLIAALLCLGFALGSHAQPLQLPDAPQPVSAPQPASAASASSSLAFSPTGRLESENWLFSAEPAQPGETAQDSTQSAPQAKPAHKGPVDKNGNPIPIERNEPQRILGFMPNFRTVSGGAEAHPPGFKYNFSVATHQALDYSSFIFLGLTSLTSEATNEHLALGKGADGFYAYTWRGFLDKSDNTYLSAWLLSSIFGEDTRYYALGAGHNVFIRSLYVIGYEGVARTYNGHKTPNIAGLGAKAITQYVSRYYYPPSAATFSVLATKFGYSVMRDIAFSSVREFYPDIAAHYVRRHQEKAARRAASTGAKTATP